MTYQLRSKHDCHDCKSAEEDGAVKECEEASKLLGMRIELWCGDRRLGFVEPFLSILGVWRYDFQIHEMR